MKKRNHPEEKLQLAVCKFIQFQHPGVVFTAESSGIRLTKSQAGKAKAMRSGAKLPDLWILEPRGGYHGLFLELKAESVWLKDKTLSKDKHVRAQAAVLDRLSHKGYYAVFACGLDQAIKIISKYMALEFNAPKPDGNIIDEWYL